MDDASSIYLSDSQASHITHRTSETVEEDLMSHTAIDSKEFTFDQEVLMTPAYKRVLISSARTREAATTLSFNSAWNMSVGVESRITSLGQPELPESLLKIDASNAYIEPRTKEIQIAELEAEPRRSSDAASVGTGFQEPNTTTGSSTESLPRSSSNAPSILLPIVDSNGNWMKSEMLHSSFGFLEEQPQNIVPISSRLTPARPSQPCASILPPVRNSQPLNPFQKITLRDFMPRRAVESGDGHLETITDIMSNRQKRHSRYVSPTEVNISGIQMTTLAEDVIRAVQDTIES